MDVWDLIRLELGAHECTTEALVFWVNFNYTGGHVVTAAEIERTIALMGPLSVSRYGEDAWCLA